MNTSLPLHESVFPLLIIKKSNQIIFFSIKDSFIQQQQRYPRILINLGQNRLII